MVKGKVVSRTDFGIFVEIEEGVEGLVHMSELASPDADWEELYKDGMELQVEIRRIDAHDRKISLSETGASHRGEQASSVQDHMARRGESGARPGDLMGNLSDKLSGAMGEEGDEGVAQQVAAEEPAAEGPVAEEPAAE